MWKGDEVYGFVGMFWKKQKRQQKGQNETRLKLLEHKKGNKSPYWLVGWEDKYWGCEKEPPPVVSSLMSSR